MGVQVHLNVFDDAVQFMRDLIVPISKDAISALFEVCVSFFIVSLRFGVLSPVDFDDELFFQADEIDVVLTDGLLSPKLKSHCEISFSQPPPQL